MTTETAPVKWEEQSISQRKQHFDGVMMQSKDQISQVLPPGFNFDYFHRSIMMILHKTPELLECTRASLYGAILQCGQLGLIPESMFAEATLMPFNKTIKGKRQADGTWSKEYKIKECSFQIGYQGLKKLAFNSDKYSDIYAVAVYKDDFFEESLGTTRYIKHTRGENEGEYRYDNPAWVYENLTHAYAVAVPKDGSSPQFVVFPKSKIEARRKRAPSQMDWDVKRPSDKPIKIWFSDYEKMCLKTLLRDLCGQLAKSTQDSGLQRALALEQAHELGRLQHSSSILQSMPGLLPPSEMLEISAEITEEYESEAEEEKDIVQQNFENKQQGKGENSTKHLLNKIGEAADSAPGLNPETGMMDVPQVQTDTINTTKGEGVPKKATTEWGSYAYKFTGPDGSVEVEDSGKEPISIMNEEMATPTNKVGTFQIGLSYFKEAKLMIPEFTKVAWEPK